MKCIDVNGMSNASKAFRYSSRQNTAGNRHLMHMWWNEMTNLYGIGVHYYVHGYQLSGNNVPYGEQPTAAFEGPTPMIILGTMDSDSILYTKWGIQSNSDFTAIIPRKVYADAFGSKAEPKSGDLIRLDEWGCDRPGACGDPYYTGETPYPETTDMICESIFTTSSSVPTSSVSIPSGYGCPGEFCSRVNWGPIVRCPYLFEVTERRDEMVTQSGYNTFMGHYVWILHCKRFDYSYQPGIAGECGNQIVTDEKDVVGIQPGGSQPVTPSKPYNDNIEDRSDNYWDYDKKPDNNTDIYGDYG